MTLRILLPVVVAVSMTAAWATDARGVLYHPVNPLRAAGPYAMAPEDLQELRGWSPKSGKWMQPTLRGFSEREEAYLRACRLYRKGEELKGGRDRQKAVYCFAEALSELIGLQRLDGGFQPMVVAYRIKAAREQLDELLAVR